MPLFVFIPSLLRIRGTPDLAEDQPHPLQAFIEPLLLSLRATANKYHNELPQILADGGGPGEAEESMMWYALGYEKVDASAEHLDREDSAMLEDKWRSGWLERMGQREFKSKLPEKCALLRSKLFPNSPFSDEPRSPGPSTKQSLSGSHSHHSSSTTAAGSQSGVTTRAPARTRSLSSSLSQEKEKERAASVSATQDKALQRALTRQISMSRAWKGKERLMAVVSQAETKVPAATAKRIIGRNLVPVKKPLPRAKSNVSARSSSPIPNVRSSSVLTTAQASSLTLLDTDDSELPSASVPLLDFSSDSLGNTLDEDEDAEEETWLPNSSPDVLLLNKTGWVAGTDTKKRIPSAASKVLTSDTPVRRRMRLGR
ncbi:hypothetical protein BDR05DRAFT_1005729 [Suillus weaverae]|nr:hypothetical protein BDR05DRAFT_1005729 [Suillus weaverae]